MEDEPRLAVQDAEQEEVPVEEVQERPDVQRHAVVAGLHPEDPLVRGPEQTGGRLPGDVPAAPRELFPGERLGIPEMLLEIELDRGLFDVPFFPGGPPGGARAARSTASSPERRRRKSFSSTLLPYPPKRSGLPRKICRRRM